MRNTFSHLVFKDDRQPSVNAWGGRSRLQSPSMHADNCAFCFQLILDFDRINREWQRISLNNKQRKKWSNRIQMILKMVIEFKFCTPKRDADLCMHVDLPLDKKKCGKSGLATRPQILNKTPQNLTTSNYFKELRRYDLHWWKDDERWSTFFFKTKSRNSCHTFVIVKETKREANQLLLLLVGRCMMKKETTAKKLRMAVRSFLPKSFSLPLFFFSLFPQ